MVLEGLSSSFRHGRFMSLDVILEDGRGNAVSATTPPLRRMLTTTSPDACGNPLAIEFDTSEIGDRKSVASPSLSDIACLRTMTPPPLTCVIFARFLAVVGDGSNECTPQRWNIAAAKAE